MVGSWSRVARVAMRHFWTAHDRPAPRRRVIERLPIAGPLAASMALVLQAEAGLTYTRAATDSLHAPQQYTCAVTGRGRLSATICRSREAASERFEPAEQASCA